METCLRIQKRAELPLLLNRLKLTGKGVEIGVQTGAYSRTILSKCNLEVLYSVDPWMTFKRNEYLDFANVPKVIQNLLYFTTKIMLKRFKKRSIILRMKSEEAVKSFKDNSLDFVYIDALHTYEGCKKDMELWWPKLKKGGVFSGHDYLNGNLINGKFGVKQAVDEFIKKHDLELYITHEFWPTWYMLKCQKR